MVNSEDGLDEISIAAPTFFAEMKNGNVFTSNITPEQFGLERGNLDELAVDSVESSLNKIRAALGGEPGAAGDIVALNSGAAIYVCGLTESLQDGVKKAQEVIRSGAANTKLEELAAFTNHLTQSS